MSTQEMDRFTLLRWKALMSGVDMIYDKSMECGLTERQVSIKQTHLVKFIDESTETVKLRK